MTDDKNDNDADQGNRGRWRPRGKRLGIMELKGHASVREYLVQGRQLLKEERYDEALAQFEEALRNNPDIAPAHLAAGNIHYKQGRLEQALTHFQRALSINGQLAPALLMAGNVYRELGDMDKALEDYEAALQIDPKLVGAQLGAGQIYLSQERLDDAEQRARESLRLNPELTAARVFLANIYLQKKDSAAAIEQLRLAINTDPKFSPAYFQLGKLHFDEGRHAEALEIFRDLVAQRPDHAVGQYFVGLSAMGCTDYAAAARGFEEALRLNPAMEAAHSQLAVALMKQGDFDRARVKLLELTRTQRRSAVVQRLLGDLYAGTGHYRQSVEAYQAALLHGPQLGEEHPQLAEILHSALSDGEKALTLREVFARVPVAAEPGGERGGATGGWRGGAMRGGRGGATGGGGRGGKRRGPRGGRPYMR